MVSKSDNQQRFSSWRRPTPVMKKSILLSVFVLLAFSVSVSAQTKEGETDAFELLLETDAKHNLGVAWQYFKMRKAYIAVLMRTEETMAAHPSFSKMDEILYLSGMSSYYLYLGKGKQRIDLSKMNDEDREKYAPEKLRSDAAEYLGQLVESYPKSKYLKKAKKALAALEADEN